MWSWDNFPITSWRDPGPNFRWPEVVRTLGRPFRHGKTFPLPHAETRKKISMPGSGSEPLTSSQPDHVSLVMGQVSHYVMTKNRKKCFMSKRPTHILRGFLHLYFSLRIYISYTKMMALLFSFHRYILLYSAPLGTSYMSHLALHLALFGDLKLVEGGKVERQQRSVQQVGKGDF